ncbi:hypothetical protein WR25_18281 [Diploscapter pachys]|uniref:Uncharacterized protein n=1 Tax=Diploscapter pachys TaxID=2018661 RepID=A0A2A2LDZ4_9BILA|nr:hypothetical protein WR25_18281 [Diploscapter pachys]
MSSSMGSITNNYYGSGAGGIFKSAYKGSKTALNQFSRTFAHDLKSDHILSVAIHPGSVQTDMAGPNAEFTISSGYGSIANNDRESTGIGAAAYKTTKSESLLPMRSMKMEPKLSLAKFKEVKSYWTGKFTMKSAFSVLFLGSLLLIVSSRQIKKRQANTIDNSSAEIPHISATTFAPTTTTTTDSFFDQLGQQFSQQVHDNLQNKLTEAMCETFYQQINLQSRCADMSDYFYTTALQTMQADDPTYIIYSAVPCPSTVQSPTRECALIYHSDKSVSYASLPEN